MAGERQPRRINKKYLALAASGAITIGGGLASYIGISRYSDEIARNHQTIGAIEHDYSAKLNRPTNNELDETKHFIQTLVNEIKSQNPHETDDAKEVTRTLISKDAEIRQHDRILAREENYQETLERTIKAADLRDTDDANLLTAIAGFAAVFSSAPATGLAAGSIIEQLRKKKASQ